MRLIDADAFVEAIKGVEVIWYLDGNYETYDDSTIMDIIEEQPTIEAVPVVRGEWIPYTISKLFSHTCSICHCDVEEKTPFCPNCGVDMRTSAE